MHVLRWLLDARLEIAGSAVLWREIVGNVFGLASALLGMRRVVWAWPAGAAGVPLLLIARFYPSAARYGVYGFFCGWGFVTWPRISHALRRQPALTSTSYAEAIA